MDNRIWEALKVLQSCEAKLEYLGQVFSGVRFTDRHGDGLDCLHRAAKARNAIAALHELANESATPSTRADQ